MALHEPTFLILTSLAEGRKHGYALIKDADDLSGGLVTLKVGTLYAALDRLARDGLIQAAGEEVAEGRLRRYYELTGEGAAQLTAEVERMRSLAAKASARLGIARVVFA
jgi:PadR family transcriptional regulator, regulatory protein PadR